MTMQGLRSLLEAPKITTCFVDLDNTIWDGIIAEGEKPRLIVARYEILKKLHQKGVQLYVVSKNDQNDVDKTFKELEIDKELFTWVITGWDPKFLNIQRLVDIAEIRPETAVFIDDNIFELNEVKQKIPAIYILDANNIDFIMSIPAITSKKEQTESEIQERKNRYRTAIQSKYLKEYFTGNDIEFYRKLKREIRLGLVPIDNLDRATRLLVETHRLNFNPGKFAEYDQALNYLHDRFSKGDLIYAVATSEGEYSLGLAGVLILQIQNKDAIITDGSFSCGIIGRDFEQKTILALIDLLKNKNIEQLKAYITATATNVRMRTILNELGFTESNKKTDTKDNLHIDYVLDIKDYSTTGKYDWISVSEKPPTFEYVGHSYVIKFFEKYVKPLIFNGCAFINLGSARGEVLGLLQKNVREEFYRFLENKSVHYTKIDLEYYPEEKNIVANAEDLRKLINDESQDIVMAVELLEHTQNPKLVLNEMIRICRDGGYIFISTPSFNFPKHEYPIDLWRFGPKTLKEIFSNTSFKIEHIETEGAQVFPRRTMLLVKKIKNGKLEVQLPIGKFDSQRNLTVFE